ncbi:MAG TPA: tol-pal system-associated acyl-CoA thioesterase [Steroidobacteraceae bacterium]|nr:tol-pal system-associated acyl-CoA thioesterase [Steroidobacteraceae bacterium]HQX78197.1 tol-pal system-associated acyl-CoA thioesterase [Steroidobacteraceae bacterium]
MSVTWPVRVYVEDTDFGGVVYYANYLRWLERARTEWLRSKGLSQAALARDSGILFSVVSVQVNYRRPARLDDELIISCEPRADGRASVRFVQQVLRGAELLADADVRVACLAASTLRPTRLPEFVIAEVG